MFGLPKIPLGLFGIADGTGTRPDNTQADVEALQSAYAAARAHNRTPQGRIDRGWSQFAPPGAPAAPAAAPAAPVAEAPPQPFGGSSSLFAPPSAAAPAFAQAAAPEPVPPALHAQAQASVPPASAPAPAVPTPQPRPDAPAPAPMGFAMPQQAVQEPGIQAFYDSLGPRQASGPDVIAKLLDMFHKKDA